MDIYETEKFEIVKITCLRRPKQQTPTKVNQYFRPLLPMLRRRYQPSTLSPVEQIVDELKEERMLQAQEFEEEMEETHELIKDKKGGTVVAVMVLICVALFILGAMMIKTWRDHRNKYRVTQTTPAPAPSKKSSTVTMDTIVSVEEASASASSTNTWRDKYYRGTQTAPVVYSQAPTPAPSTYSIDTIGSVQEASSMSTISVIEVYL